MADLFKKTKSSISGYVGSVKGDANAIGDKLKGQFGSKESISNMFDQRVSDGLSDLLTGITGIRTSSIPEISAETLQTREKNREARAQVLNDPTAGRKRASDSPAKQVTFQFPQNFSTEKDEAGNMQNYIHFRSLERKNREPGEAVYDIFLYVPSALDGDVSVTYDAEEKGLIEGMIAKFMGRGQGGTDQGIMAGLGQQFKEAMGGSVGKATAGKVINPLEFQIFKGVEKRSFSYDFVLYPENQSDSIIIRSICYAFKETALPGIVPNSGNKIYTFPNEWAIRFHGPMKEWIDYPMTCVLTSVGVDYTPEGNQRMHDGAPIGVGLKLEFEEVFTLDRIKYRQRVAAQTGNNREISQEGGSLPDVLGVKAGLPGSNEPAPPPNNSLIDDQETLLGPG